MKLEIEIGDVIADQIQTAIDLTGLSRDEMIRRALMTFCWISPQDRWEFLHLLDHPLVEAGVGMARIAQLLEDVRRIVPQAPEADWGLATRVALEAVKDRLDVPPDYPRYIDDLVAIGRFLGAPTVKEIAAIAELSKRAQDAFHVHLWEGIETAAGFAEQGD